MGRKQWSTARLAYACDLNDRLAATMGNVNHQPQVDTSMDETSSEGGEAAATHASPGVHWLEARLAYVRMAEMVESDVGSTLGGDLLKS